MPVLEKSLGHITRKRPELVGRWILRHDNAHPHMAHLVQEWLERDNIEVMVHPAYSPHLCPCDFWLFPTLKRCLRGWFFESDEEVIHKIQKSLARIPEGKFCQTIEEKWVKRLEQCIASQGRYVEKDGSSPNNSECEDDNL